MRRNRRATVLFALIVALFMVGPLTWMAFAEDAPPVPPDGGNLASRLDTDSLTGGVLPAAPVPSSPIPSGVPNVPTDLDPRGTEDVPDGPVTIDLGPNGSSGVSGTLTVDGRDVRGTATGLKPGKRYISLYYGDMSTAAAGQTLTCADARTALLTQQWILTGEWDVDENGDGTFTGTAPRDLADGVYTASIRRVPSTAGQDPSVGFTPVQYPVVACGAVPAEGSG